MNPSLKDNTVADPNPQKAHSSSNKMSSSTVFYIPVWLKMKIFSVSNVRSVWLNLAIGLAPWNNKMLGTATVPNLVERLQEREVSQKTWINSGLPHAITISEWMEINEEGSVSCDLWRLLILKQQACSCSWQPSSWVMVGGIRVLFSELLSVTTWSCPWHNYSTSSVFNSQNRSDQKILIYERSTLCQFT